MAEQEVRMSLESLLDAKPGDITPALRTLRWQLRRNSNDLDPNQLNSTIADRTQLRTPEIVIQAVEKISQGSQYNFTSTWIGDELSNRRRVVIREEDKLEYPDVNFVEALELILQHRDGLLQIDPPLPNFNAFFAHKVRAAVAKNHLTRDVVRRETEGVSRLLAVGGLAGMAEYLWQELRGLTPFAYAIASTFDNGFAMIAEGKKLRQQGFSFKETAANMLTPSLILGMSIALSNLVHSQFNSGSRSMAGITYGMESGICTTPSLAAAVVSLRQHYIELVRQGKVEDPALAKLLNIASPKLSNRGEIFIRSALKALRHDFIYPHHLGLYTGAIAGIILSAISANVPLDDQFLMQHPAVLVPLGVADSLGGAVAASLVDPIYNVLLLLDLKNIQKQVLQERSI